MLTADGKAAGDFTHLIVDIGDYPGSDLAGTRITKILQFAGVSLVKRTAPPRVPPRRTAASPPRTREAYGRMGALTAPIRSG